MALCGCGFLVNEFSSAIFIPKILWLLVFHSGHNLIILCGRCHLIGRLVYTSECCCPKRFKSTRLRS